MVKNLIKHPFFLIQIRVIQLVFVFYFLGGILLAQPDAIVKSKNKTNIGFLCGLRNNPIFDNNPQNSYTKNVFFPALNIRFEKEYFIKKSLSILPGFILGTHPISFRLEIPYELYRNNPELKDELFVFKVFDFSYPYLIPNIEFRRYFLETKKHSFSIDAGLGLKLYLPLTAEIYLHTEVDSSEILIYGQSIDLSYHPQFLIMPRFGVSYYILLKRNVIRFNLDYTFPINGNKSTGYYELLGNTPYNTYGTFKLANSLPEIGISYQFVKHK